MGSDKTHAGITVWPAEAIWEAIAPSLPGFTVEVLPQLDSTNSELMRRARAGQTEPVLLVAEKQTAGRGRLGRQWFSDMAETSSLGGRAATATTSMEGHFTDGAPLSALTFSLGMPLTPRDWSGLSLAVGLSLVESLHPDLRLKWPNDVWLQGRKLAGILIETTSVGDLRYLVVGVGINLSPPLAHNLSTPPAWLTEVLPAMTAPQVLQRLIAPLVKTLQVFEQQGFLPFQARFNARDALAGLAVTLSDGVSGSALGVDSTGALQVQTAQGLRHITSAEVSVRPAAVAALDKH